jgi:hypothetical protein
MRTLAASAAIALSLAWSSSSAAQEADLHTQSVSPEASRGVNPGTTRGLNRGLPGAASAVEPRPEVEGDARSVTTTTAATWGAPEARPDVDRPTQTVTSTPNRTLLFTGSAIFLGTYVASAIVGTTVGTDADENLAIPVVGPWIALGERSCTFGECGLHEDVNVLGLIASGVAQAAGIGLAITSLFVSEARPVKTSGVRLAPMAVGRAGAGIGAGGAF